MSVHTRPKTTQERRLTCIRGEFLDIDGYRIRIRASRNWKNLPNAYDDLMISNLNHHSWKRHRRTQYRPR